MENFIKKIEEVLEKPKGSIHSYDVFRTYDEWDSLALLSLMAMLEDEYGNTIPREVFEKLNTIEDLYNFIISK
jgi:acyl carrier protein